MAIPRILLTALLIATLGSAAQAAPLTITVGCGLGPGFDYSSLQAAVTAADGSPDSITIEVAGDCVEQVTIQRATSLTIDGQGSARIIHPGGPGGTTAGALVSIFDSNHVDLRRLSLVGPGGSGLTASNSTAVRLIDAVVDGFSVGVFMQSMSSGTIAGSTISGSGARGIVVSPLARLELVGAPHNLTGNPTIVRGSASDGVQVAGHAQLVGEVIVEDNGGPGVAALFGGSVSMGGPSTRTLRRNNVGLAINGGSADVTGTRIEENRLGGVIQDGGFLVLRLGVVVANNLGESPRPLGVAPAGVVVHGGYLTLQGGAQVSGNVGYGVMVGNSGTARINGAVVTGNSEHGVRVQALGSLFVVGLSASGNQRWDLSCTADAAAHGDVGQVARVRCPGFRHTVDGVVR